MNNIGDDSVNDDDYWYVDNGDSITQPLNLKPQLESLTNNPTTQTPYDEPYDPADEESARYAWKVASWIIVALTLLLNLVIVVVIVINRNANSVINKALLTLGIVDLIYGIFVSPFFIENYVDTDWEQGHGYCGFFIYMFTFHDLFVPLVLILLSAYVSLKFAGATEAFQSYKKQVYIGLFVLCLLFSIFLAIPATVYSDIVTGRQRIIDPSTCTLQKLQERVRDVGNSVGERNLELNGCLELCESTAACESFVYVISQKRCQMKDKTIVGYEPTVRDPDSFTVYKKCDIVDYDPRFREECRSYDTYSMVLTYFLASSLLFCFTMSFLFSLCIVGSPLLRDVYNDNQAFRQRWRLLLTLSLINSFYIISGFLLNFKEISRFVYTCCDIQEPFTGISEWRLTYDIWSFVLLIAEPFLRPLASLSFYFKYLYSDPLTDAY